MYGTVARFQLKPGMEAKLQEEMKSYDDQVVDGYVGTTVYRMDENANEYYMAVVFRDKDAYFKNADSPEQNKRYETFRAMLSSDPEWHDGEIVFSGK